MKTQLEKQIMRRVYLTYMLRKILQPVLVKVYIVLALVWQASRYVSVPDVFTNASAALQPEKMYHFYVSAFANTEGIVQIAIIGSALLAVWALRDIAFREGESILQKV